MSRRDFLSGLGAVATVAACGRLAAQTLSHNPFFLCVASGSPSQDGFVLWTRLVAAPLGTPLPAAAIEVGWQVALDPLFRQLVQTGTTWALPDEAHSVHLEVSGLPPAAPQRPSPSYWYRFRVGQSISAVGRTSVLPSPRGQPVLRLALASCQNYEHGFFGAYKHMTQEALDLVLFVGDYIYEYGATPGRTRQHDGGTCYSLDDYRRRYALYKSDPDLQAAHAAFPWILTWDDHEVANDYARDRSATERGAAFFHRRAAAYRAYWEHQPLRRAQKPLFAELPLYRSYRWGQTANLHVLDARQYRDPQVCTSAEEGGSRSVTDESCPIRRQANLSLLGEAQDKWLEQQLERSQAAFDLIGQQSIMAQMRMSASRLPEDQPANTFWTDSWDGYPQARARALASWGRRQNVISLGGDVHASYISDLKADFDDPASPTLASEVVGTSISSPSWPQVVTERVLRQNPHMKFARSDRRGYTVLEVGPELATVNLRVIDNARVQSPSVETAASFVIDRKRPGIQHS